MFINWKQRELHLKVVYCGPPLSGKTTNLEQIHQRVPAERRSELVSIKTREDRTLFFDFMQIEVGPVNGLQPKFKLYTVPGQSYYAATRKLVLQDVDGLVFVADSSVQRLAANRQSLHQVWQQLEEIGRLPEQMPFVLQCNKQDLTKAVPPRLLSRFLGLNDAPCVPAVARRGEGTAETLKTIISQVVTRL